MEHIKKILFLVTVLALLTSGCYRNTTVILPPDQRPDDPTQPTAQTIPATGVPTEASTVPPTTEPTEAPTDPPTEPPTEVPTEAPTAPPTEAPTDPPATEPPAPSDDEYIYEILSALNAARSGQALSKLTLSNGLSGLAEIRAAECARQFSSTRPDGRDWNSVLTDYGYSSADATGEIRGNTSEGFPADILVETWMYTDSSMGCILSPEADRCGIGIFQSGSQIYIVVIFTK